jgi:hypothetical protein
MCACVVHLLHHSWLSVANTQSIGDNAHEMHAQGFGNHVVSRVSAPIAFVAIQTRSCRAQLDSNVAKNGCDARDTAGEGADGDVYHDVQAAGESAHNGPDSLVRCFNRFGDYSHVLTLSVVGRSGALLFTGRRLQ